MPEFRPDYSDSIYSLTNSDLPMETKELNTHQRGVILRGICGGAALKGKSPLISENNTVITCTHALNVWDICCIRSDAEAFGLKVKFGYDGQTIITFTHKK